MHQDTKTAVELRVDELSATLSIAATEFADARAGIKQARARWDDAQDRFTGARENLETYLGGLEDDMKITQDD